MLTNAFALVKRNDAFGLDGFAGKAIWERGVGVEAGDGWVEPGAMDGGPAGDDPAFALGIAAGGPVADFYFVGGDALVEFWRALEHHTHLRAQFGEFIGRAIANPHFHFHDILLRNHGAAECDAVGECALHAE